MAETTRNHRFDTIRAVLVFLVVFAHMLEQMPSKGSLYLIIYSFHGYALLFVSGYFARFSAKKVLLLLVPYALLQIVFLIGSAIFLPDTVTMLQFSTPVWILWYFLVLSAYLCVEPLLKRIRPRAQIPFFLLTVAGAVGVGFVDDIGYYLSLSRMFVFFPFFVAGFFCGRNPRLRRLLESSRKDDTISGGQLLIIFSTMVVLFMEVDYRTLYGSYSYAHSGSDAVERLILMAVAFCWIWALFILIPTRKVRFFTSSGRYTLPVYALHGFFVLLIGQLGVFRFGTVVNLLLAFVLTVAIVAFLGSKPVDRFFTWAFLGMGFARHMKKTMTTDDFETRPSIFRQRIEPNSTYMTRLVRQEYLGNAITSARENDNGHVATRFAHKLCSVKLHTPIEESKKSK